MAESRRSSLSLAKVLARRARGVEYREVPTALDGVRLRVERGRRPRLVESELGMLATESRLYVARAGEIKALEEAQKEPHDNLVEMAREHKGLRGVVSERDRIGLSIIPNYRIEWQRGPLQAALGEAVYQTVAGEEVECTVSVPLGRETPNGPLTAEMVADALLKGLRELGFSEEDTHGIAKVDIATKVDEVKLGRMVVEGQAKVPPSAGTPTEGWSVTPRPFDQP